MSRKPARATQADIARAIRAIRAVEQTGAQMEIRVERDCTIRIVPYIAPSAPANDAKHEGVNASHLRSCYIPVCVAAMLRS